MGDCEEADLVYMCNKLKAIGEKLRDLTHVEKNHSKSQKKNVDTNDHINLVNLNKAIKNRLKQRLLATY